MVVATLLILCETNMLATKHATMSHVAIILIVLLEVFPQVSRAQGIAMLAELTKIIGDSYYEGGGGVFMLPSCLITTYTYIELCDLTNNDLRLYD